MVEGYSQKIIHPAIMRIALLEIHAILDEGDKAYFHFKSDGSLGLAEKFDGDYDKNKLLSKLFKTSKIFENIIDIEKVFTNYSLKKNKEKLDILLNS